MTTRAPAVLTRTHMITPKHLVYDPLYVVFSNQLVQDDQTRVDRATRQKTIPYSSSRLYFLRVAGRQAGVGVKQAEPGSHRLRQEHSRHRKLQRDNAPGEKDQPAAHNSCIFPHDAPCVQRACALLSFVQPQLWDVCV